MNIAAELPLPKQFIVVRGTEPFPDANRIDIGILKPGGTSVAVDVKVTPDGVKTALGHVDQVEAPGRSLSLTQFSNATTQARAALDQLESNIPDFSSLGALMPTIRKGDVVVLYTRDAQSPAKFFRYTTATMPQALRDVVAGWDLAVSRWPRA